MKLQVQNSSAASIHFYLEPWGEVFDMPAGAVFEVRCEATTDEAAPQVEYGEQSITVYGWPGSTLQVFQGDVELGAGTQPRFRVPGVPPGMNVTQFVKSMFGHQGG
jgi:hypothetical protein